jgi:hypothetical protein
VTDRRLATPRAALGFLQLAPRAPELRLLHRWLDTWTSLGLIVVGIERHGLRFSLSHIADDEWRAQFSAHPMWASAPDSTFPVELSEGKSYTTMWDEDQVCATTA